MGCPQRPGSRLVNASPDRRMEHPNGHLARWTGVLQADAYGGYNDLYRPDRRPAPITGALCWAHARRKFFELADIAAKARRGAERAAVIATLIMTAKLNDVDPQAWLADVLARIADHPAQRLDGLLPWNWRPAAVGALPQAA